MTTTIPYLKHQFLTGQIRILNAPLDPPEEWRDAAPKTKSGYLNDRIVDDVLAKANRTLRTHNAHCFPPMVLEHVAAQIDALYWSQTTTSAVLEGHEDIEGSVPVDADLHDDAVIASLPPALPTNADDQSSPGSRSLSRRSVLESDDLATRYGRLLRELRLLSARRKDAEVRKEQAKALLEVLAPLRNPNESVQGNLVIEDGELVAELVRMRGLLTRIREGF